MTLEDEYAGLIEAFERDEREAAERENPEQDTP
jgi:hypothetical protein